MGNSVGQNIDSWARANMDYLRKKEDELHRPLTKYDVAKFMSEKKDKNGQAALSVMEFSVWTHSKEGDSAKKQSESILLGGSIFTLGADGKRVKSYLDSIDTSYDEKTYQYLGIRVPSEETLQKKNGPTTADEKLAYNEFKKRLESAKASFQKRLDDDTVFEDIADVLGRIYYQRIGWIIGSEKNYADAVRADLDKYTGYLNKLYTATKAGDAEFKRVYKEIFKVDYNAQNIRNYQQASKAYEAAFAAKFEEEEFNSNFTRLLSGKGLVGDRESVGGAAYATPGAMAATQTAQQKYDEDFNKLAKLFDGITDLNKLSPQETKELHDLKDKWENPEKYAWNDFMRKQMEASKDRDFKRIAELEAKQNGALRQVRAELTLLESSAASMKAECDQISKKSQLSSAEQGELYNLKSRYAKSQQGGASAKTANFTEADRARMQELENKQKLTQAESEKLSQYREIQAKIKEVKNNLEILECKNGREYLNKLIAKKVKNTLHYKKDIKFFNQ